MASKYQDERGESERGWRERQRNEDGESERARERERKGRGQERSERRYGGVRDNAHVISRGYPICVLSNHRSSWPLLRAAAKVEISE